MKNQNAFGPCTPFFIVANVAASIGHYTQKLGFECRFTSPGQDPFFAIVGRGLAQIMVKNVGDEVPPSPNHQMHEWAPWDAFIHVQDPDALAREIQASHVEFHQRLGNTEDGLRGFSIKDPDNYVCFFGRPA